MTFDEDMQTALLDATEDVAGGPDLGLVLREGRRRRRRHSASVGVAALAVVGLGAGTAYQLGQGPSHRTGHDPETVATAPSYHDFVPGTDTDEQLQAVVAGDLPALPAADAVVAFRYEGARQIMGWRRATEWTLRYPVNGQRLFVTVQNSSDPHAVTCDRVTHVPDEGQPDCTRVDLPAGGYVVNDSFEGVVHLNDPYFVFASTYVRPDGSAVDVRQQVSAAETWREAVRDVTYAPGELTGLLTDPGLHFPDPAS
jgi:hypothetical protein